MSDMKGRAGGSQSETALNIIRDRILDLTLAPGSHVDERALMSRYGLGRTPTREALNRLAAEGLVTILANRGAFVRSLDLAETTNFFDAYFAAERLVGYFCRFDDDTLVADLIGIQKRHHKAVIGNAFLDITRHNADFHLRIAAATENPYVYELSVRVHAAARRMLFFIYRGEKDRSVLNVFDEEQQGLIEDHNQIIGCIRAADRDALIQTVTEHGCRLQRRLIDLISQSPGMTFQPGVPEA